MYFCIRIRIKMNVALGFMQKTENTNHKIASDRLQMQEKKRFQSPNFLAKFNILTMIQYLFAKYVLLSKHALLAKAPKRSTCSCQRVFNLVLKTPVMKRESLLLVHFGLKTE